MYPLFQIEQRKIVSRKLFWILFVINLAFNALFTLQFWGSHSSPSAELLWPQTFDGGIEVINVIVALLVIILVGSVIGQGYVWRTTQQTLARGTARLQFVLASFAAFLLPIFAGFVLPSIVFQIVNGLIFNVVKGVPIDFMAADWGMLAQEIVVAYAMLLVYAALTFLIAFATRSTVAAISIGIFIALVMENLLLFTASFFGEWAQEAVKYLPGQLYFMLLTWVTASAEALNSDAFSELIPATTATAALCIYLILGVGIAYIALRRQDLSG
ncbi:MAG TPA: hypothetical protein ENJ56_08655 [Anaerolineae bacterium]|nr:hypothetical protein [Anaerolineae bacterium]